MNNYELASDEYCFVYRKYKTKKMTWKAFKKICGKDWIKGQMLCERHNVVLTDHRTRRENYIYWFDRIIKKLLKFIKGSKKNQKKDYEKIFFGKTKKEKRKLKIMKEKPYNFNKMNNELLGTKRKIW